MYEHDDLFASVWRQLAEQGKCDAVGGEQFRRVRGEFFKSIYIRGCIVEFILQAANRPLESFPHTDVSRLFENGGE